MNNKEIAVFGGTFDPIHIGHYRIVEYLINNKISDKVLILPSYYSPHKTIDTKKSFCDRVSMIKLAFKNINDVDISLFEEELYNRNNDKSYSFDVLNALQNIYKDYRLSFVVGFDSIKNIHTWHDFKSLIQKYKFYVFDRADNDLKDKNHRLSFINEISKEYDIEFNYKLFDVEIPDISSQVLREKLADYNNNISIIKNYLNNEVLDYILENKLYGT